MYIGLHKQCNNNAQCEAFVDKPVCNDNTECAQSTSDQKSSIFRLSEAGINRHCESARSGDYTLYSNKAITVQI